MSTYTPTKAEQQKYTQPVDGDDPSTLLARILSFLQGLADGAAAAARIAFDWQPGIATSAPAVEACFDTVDQAWWIVGSSATDKMQASWDRGRSWNAATLGFGSTLVAVATDAAGNGLAIDAAGGAYFGTRSAFATVAWAHHAGALSDSPSVGNAGLCFDTVHGNWITVYAHTGTAVHAEFAHGGFTFTPSTIPASWTTATGWAQCHVNVNALGDAVAAMLITGGFFILSRSSDGGVTWHDPALVPAIDAAFDDVSRPTYDPVLDEWYVALSVSTGGGPNTHVLRSTDGGVSWTDVGVATPNMVLVDCEAINGVLVAISVDGRIFRSADRGVTWSGVAFNAVGNAPSPGNFRLRAGDGQLLEISRDDAHVCASTVVGAKGGAAQ